MEQFNNLTEFRQATYEHGLTKAGDAQFELVDAMLLGRPIRSFPELSCFCQAKRGSSAICVNPQSEPNEYNRDFTKQEGSPYARPSALAMP